jgi:DNA repair protein RadC
MSRRESIDASGRWPILNSTGSSGAGVVGSKGDPTVSPLGASLETRRLESFAATARVDHRQRPAGPRHAMSLLNLPIEARPREKLLARGPAALADAELLALLLRTGIAGTDVLRLAQQVLDRFGGFARLLHAQPSDLGSIKGLGPAKRAELAAVVEIARRALAQQLTERRVFDNPGMVRDYAALQLREMPHECFAVMFLDAQHRLIVMQTMFEGTLTQTAVYPREIVKRALQLNAAAVILVHNHPSGVAQPSRADEHLTQHVKSALALVDVRVLDHLIVSREGSTSFAEQGLL